VDDAMLRSRFNTYHEFDKAVRHVKLATSVPADNLSFSIEAHGFRSLPDDKPLDRVLAAVAAILENTEALRQHVDDIPAM